MTAAKIKKKLSVAAIKSGELVGAPVPATVDILVNGEEYEVDTFISQASYDTAIARYQAFGEKREALAGIIASRLVNEKGQPEFTEAEVRQYFNESLTTAVWNKIYEVDHPAGKNLTTETTNSGTSLSSTESAGEPLPKPGETSAPASSNSGESTDNSVGHLTQAEEQTTQSPG